MIQVKLSKTKMDIILTIPFKNFKQKIGDFIFSSFFNKVRMF